MKRLVGVSLFCVMMAWPAARSVAVPATADHASRPADSSGSAGQDREKAKEYFRRAQLLFNGGKYTLAVREFESAYALWKHPNIEFNLAVVYALLGNYVASVRFQNLLRQHAPDKLLQLPAEAKAAQQKVGTVVVSAQNPNAVIYVNGDKVGRRHVKVVVLVGRAVLEVRLGSRVVASKAVQVHPGQQTVYEFASLKVSHKVGRTGGTGNGTSLGSGSAGGPSSGHRSWQRLHWAYFASTLAVAVGLAAGATWSSIHSKKLYDDYMDDRSNAQLRSDGITSVRTSNILWGVAGGVGAAAVILAVFTRWRNHSEQVGSTQSVVPLIYPGGAGVSFSWRQ